MLNRKPLLSKVMDNIFVGNFSDYYRVPVYMTGQGNYSRAREWALDNYGPGSYRTWFVSSESNLWFNSISMKEIYFNFVNKDQAFEFKLKFG